MAQATHAQAGRRPMLAAPLALTLALALGLIGFLGFVHYERTLDEALRSRIALIVGDIAADIERGLTLGLALGELSAVGDMIEREAAHHEEILTIAVLDDRRQVRFATGPVPEVVPERWLAVLDGREPEPADGRTEIAAPLRNSFGLVVGGLVVAYDGTGLEATARATRDLLVAVTAGILIGGVLLLTVTVAVLERRRAS
jgi:hypothetical protein